MNTFMPVYFKQTLYIFFELSKVDDLLVFSH